jgi:GH15 family glucan-1,4-alpha-glucosidase
MDEYVLEETPARLVASIQAYWKAWIDKDENDLSMFSPELQQLYRQSLTTIRVHTDNRGGIIASSDTDMLHHGRDTYSYVWPRDGALIVRVLDEAGYIDISQQFYEFITGCIEPAGYLMHKYRSDKTLGSSWHSWLNHGVPRLPIQEDETALVLAMLWRHYDQNRDLEFIESLYNPFIEPAAQFMMNYVEPATGLPQASFDLWEEKYLTSTFTTSVTVEALLAASRFALLLGKESDARAYQAVAQRMQQAIMQYLYDDELGMFVKGVTHLPDGTLEYDRTVDTSSFFGPVFFDIVDVHDERIVRSLQTVNERLYVQASSEGYIRYEKDTYYTMHDAGTPNPWVITTLWIAQYYIKAARSLKDLEPAYQLLEWTCSHTVGAGVLAEQMHPHTRAHLSTAPLVWSHAEFAATIHAYRDAYLSFKTTDGNG